MSAPSRRGLFAATGNTAKPVHVRDLLTGEIRIEEKGLPRRKDDFYATPPEPTRALLHAEGDRLRQLGELWEPAAGDGAIARELRAVGLPVFCSDLVDRGCGATIRDFYEFEPNGIWPTAIVTNPPFSECSWGTGKARWLFHALDVLDVEYMALLLPFAFPAAAGLGPLWDRRPPARVYVVRWRIDFTGQGASPATNAWFVWDRAHKGEPALRMLDRKDARQGGIFAEAAE